MTSAIQIGCTVPGTQVVIRAPHSSECLQPHITVRLKRSCEIAVRQAFTCCNCRRAGLQSLRRNRSVPAGDRAADCRSAGLQACRVGQTSRCALLEDDFSHARAGRSRYQNIRSTRSSVVRFSSIAHHGPAEAGHYVRGTPDLLSAATIAGVSSIAHWQQAEAEHYVTKHVSAISFLVIGTFNCAECLIAQLRCG